MGPGKLLRLAHFTRRFAPYRNPIAYPLSRWLLKACYPAGKKRPPCPLVVEYDQGLINVDTASFIEYDILFDGYFEPMIAGLIRKVVKPGSVCLDIGANIGAHTLVMAFAAGPSGKVVSVEPIPQLAARLMSNVALNALKNVTLVNAAVSSEDGTATFYTFEEGAFNQGVSGFGRSAQATRPVTVQTLSGETLLKQLSLPSCDLVKIDVEGYELQVLKAISGLIARYRPALIFECKPRHWERCGSSVDEAFKMLRDWNYAVYNSVGPSILRPADGPITHSCDLFCVAKS